MFHINQVGTVNTGDITIQGHQIGIQINHGDFEIKAAMVYDRPEVIADRQITYDLRGATIDNLAHEVHGNQITQLEELP